MLINTAVLGQVDVDEQNIYKMPEGLYGFEEEHKWALITQQDEGLTLMWLQAVGDDTPCFVVFDPFEIVQDYSPKLEEADLKQLGVKSEDQLSFLVIAVVPEDFSQISVNLKSPIALNPQTNDARQVILGGEQVWPIKYYLMGQDGNPPAQED